MKNLSLLGLLLLVFFSCRQDIDEDGKIEITTDPPIIINEYDPISELVSGTVYGRVYDENENPVENAVVTYEGKIFNTDADGRFFIENEPLDHQGTFFTVEADGYFKGSRRIYPKDGSTNYAYVQLLALNDAGSFESATGGEIVGDDGLRITFAENSIQSSNGALYNGEVTVAAKWLDPTASNIAEIMPGDLLGLNARVEEVSLVTYGMMAVELFDEDGNNVNIAEGNTATLSFPVPQELINEAPAEIPLWSFYDEQYGVWVEEGSAALEGDRYVGQVSHFSFWNCDVPFPLVYVEGQLVTEEGVPLPNTTICIYADGMNSGRCGTTDNRGFFAGKMPAGKNLNLNAGSIFRECPSNNPINLGSFNVDENIGDVKLSISEGVITFSGSLVDCNDDPTKAVIIDVGGDGNKGTFFITVDTFNISSINCYDSEQVVFTFIDMVNFKQTDTLGFVDSAINFGEIKICDVIPEFLTLNIDGLTLTKFDVIAAHNNDTITTISDLSCRFDNIEIGTYDYQDPKIMFGWIQAFHNVEGGDLYYLSKERINNLEITITSVGGDGDVFAGTFNGNGDASLSGGVSTLEDIDFSGEFRYILK